MTQNNDKDGVVIIGSTTSGAGRAMAAASMRATQAVILTTPSKGGSAFVDKYTDKDKAAVEQHQALADMDKALGSLGVYSARIGEQQSNTAVNVEAKQNAATALLSKIGAAPEPKPNAIPCGYKEQISEGKTLMCGNTYRGETFYCRDCMKAMLSNAHDMANNIAEMMLVAVTDHDIEGKVSDSTIQVMRDFLVNIGAVSPE